MGNSQQPPRKPGVTPDWLTFSGLGFQILAVLGFFGWLGYWLDNRLNLTFPLFLLLFGLIAFIGVMVKLYKSL